MDKSVYLERSDELEARMAAVADTPFTMWAKVIVLATMNMRYEKVAFADELPRHPYLLTRDIIEDALSHFAALMDVAFIESENKDIGRLKSPEKEDKHRELFDEMWDRHDEGEFRAYIDRYAHRIDVNRLSPLIDGKRCVDLGCGNGAFAFALLELGAAFAAGVDFGGKSVGYANAYADRMGLSDRSEFKVATVYETGYEDASFDFAIQNGVFHHLDDEDRAIVEAARILRPGGWFWYYTDGEGGISYDLFDASVRMLRDVPVLFIEGVLDSMNVSRNKVVHLTDGMSATYRHTSWDEITGRLARFGFGEFRRLVGGTDTDFDHDRIQADPYGAEKFGEGDLRVLCRKTAS